MLMWVRIDAEEARERAAGDGHDRMSGGWGKPPPAHVLRELPGWNPN